MKPAEFGYTYFSSSGCLPKEKLSLSVFRILLREYCVGDTGFLQDFCVYNILRFRFFFIIVLIFTLLF
jgi:hypothetical protein